MPLRRDKRLSPLKKSTTQALKLIYQLIKYPLSNALVVRRYANTLKDSCYTQLKWAIHRFGVDEFFKCKESPLEITYIPTGQKIYFRGLDDSLKITSITCEIGAICWLWCEECYEIEDEDEFDKLCDSLMGDLPDGYFRQISLTFNPWSESTWIKPRFSIIRLPMCWRLRPTTCAMSGCQTMTRRSLSGCGLLNRRGTG